MGLFTVGQARIELERLRPVLSELVVVRADLVELSAALTPGGAPSPLGGLPERKAARRLPASPTSSLIPSDRSRRRSEP